MGAISRLLKKIDTLAPNPWYVEGVKQARPLTQILTFIVMTTIVIFLIASCDFKDTDNNYYDINLKIVSFNSDCSLTNDKFKTPQLCNTILFETLDKRPKQYLLINTCQMSPTIHIDTKWLYNHRVGDIVHFEFLRKENFFTINR